MHGGGGGPGIFKSGMRGVFLRLQTRHHPHPGVPLQWKIYLGYPTELLCVVRVLCPLKVLGCGALVMTGECSKPGDPKLGLKSLSVLLKFVKVPESFCE